MNRVANILLLTLCALGLATTAVAETYAIDGNHSDVNFKIRHLISKVSGGFGSFSGRIELDPANLTKGSVTFEIDATSIDTNNEDRDNHLRGEDFFHVEEYPKITFESTGVKEAKNGDLTVMGDLTMRGVTKPIALNVAVGGFATDPWGNERAGFEVTGTIDRKEFGIVWNKDLDKGGALLGDEVEVTINIEAVMQKEAEAAR